MYISDSIKYIGVNDHKIDLFEGQYAVPNGMAYNSYIIKDSKIIYESDYMKEIHSSYNQLALSKRLD